MNLQCGPDPKTGMPNSTGGILHIWMSVCVRGPLNAGLTQTLEDSIHVVTYIFSTFGCVYVCVCLFVSVCVVCVVCVHVWCVVYVGCVCGVYGV